VFSTLVLKRADHPLRTEMRRYFEEITKSDETRPKRGKILKIMGPYESVIRKPFQQLPMVVGL
jgi:hypothetical protein